MIEYFFGPCKQAPEIQLERLVRRTSIVKQAITCIVSGTYNGQEVYDVYVVDSKLSDSSEYTLIVRGDIKTDGILDLTDVSKLILHYNILL